MDSCRAGFAGRIAGAAHPTYCEWTRSVRSAFPRRAWEREKPVLQPDAYFFGDVSASALFNANFTAETFSDDTTFSPLLSLT